jgi:hypothetical protein
MPVLDRGALGAETAVLVAGTALRAVIVVKKYLLQ